MDENMDENMDESQCQTEAEPMKDTSMKDTGQKSQTSLRSSRRGRFVGRRSKTAEALVGTKGLPPATASPAKKRATRHLSSKKEQQAITSLTPKERMSSMFGSSNRAKRSSITIPTAGTAQPANAEHRSLRRARTVEVKSSGQDNNAPSPTAPPRRSLRKNRTVDERITGSTPKRSFSSGIRAQLPLRLHSANVNPQTKRNSSSSNHKRISRSSSSKPTTHLNIFGSDMVSQDFILTQLDQLEQDPNIVLVELEDCLVAGRKAVEIPQRIKEILGGQVRPWEGIHFVDELLDGFAYKEFKKHRKHFVRAMDGVCRQQMIASQFKTRVNINLDDANKGETTLPQLIQLLEEFQKDPSIVRLNIANHESNPELIRALEELMACDQREWEGISLRLGGISGDGKATTKFLERTAEARNIEMDLVLVQSALETLR